MLEHADLTGAIIGAAMVVHRELGPGFLETAYENALVIELRAKDISFEQQLSVPVLYRGAEVAKHRLDLLVDRKIVVELKALRHLETTHLAIVRSYLRATRQRHGLLLNFGNEDLEIRRVMTVVE